MSHRALLLFAAIALSAGCVPVTEPVSDITKAEPDKALVGKWDGSGGMTIDVPEVKGNPKGLMRSGDEGKLDNPKEVLWFFTSTVGKNTYANIILGAEGVESPPFHKEGEFAKWQKEPRKRYFIFLYTIDGETLTIDGGSEAAVKKLMTTEKIKGNGLPDMYQTPAGWLAKYLDKTGPGDIFDGTNKQVYTRAKKK